MAHRPSAVLAAVMVVALTMSPAHVTASPQSRAGARAVMATFDGLRGADLWPGFDAFAYPVAIFDGDTTFLFRHPQPPPEFVPLPAEPGVFAYPGRHSALTANSSALIGGVRTATVLPGDSTATVIDRTATMVHEMFHIFALRHPRWPPNEVSLFTYPFDDSVGLFNRRLESDALALALTASGEQARCWARAALSARRSRFAALPPGAIAYERAGEW